MVFYMRAWIRSCLRAGVTGSSRPFSGQGGLVYCGLRSRTVPSDIQSLVCTGSRCPEVGVQSWLMHGYLGIDRSSSGMLHKPQV